MKFKLFFLFILFALISCEPTSVQMLDGFYENGNPQRINYFTSIDQSQILKMELYFEGGELKLLGNYKENVKHGRWTYYFKNGSKSDESWFYKGLLHGRSSSFYKNGKLRSSGYYQNGIRTRIWTFFDEEGHLLKKIDFSR